MIHIHFVFYEKIDDPDEMPTVYSFGVESTIGQVVPGRILSQLDASDYMPMIANVVYLH
jgi:hypothetical protein